MTQRMLEDLVREEKKQNKKLKIFLIVLAVLLSIVIIFLSINNQISVEDEKGTAQSATESETQMVMIC